MTTEKQNAAVLLPCPFCGGEAGFERMGTPRQSCIVECHSCGARLESGEEGGRCGERWNTRAAPASPVAEARITPAEIDALRKDAERYHVLRNRDYEFVVERDRPGWRTTLPIGKGLDAAIDAAIALADGREGT